MLLKLYYSKSLFFTKPSTSAFTSVENLWKHNRIFLCTIIFNPFLFCWIFRMFPMFYYSEMINSFTLKTLLCAHLIISLGQIPGSGNTETKLISVFHNKSTAKPLSRKVKSTHSHCTTRLVSDLIIIISVLSF